MRAGDSYNGGMDTLRLGILQYDPVWCDPAANRKKIEPMLHDCSGCDLLVLPEMSLTGFCMDPARSLLGDADHAWFAELARFYDMGIAYGCVEQGSNRFVLLGRDGQRCGTYDKRHLFGLGGEPSSYKPGYEIPTWEFEGWRIRPAICYDLRFSYHFWEGASEVDLALVPACWPAAREAHWRSLLVARAIENQFYVAGVNRVGRDPQVHYNGASLLIDPNGAVVHDSTNSVGVFVEEISLEAVKLQRARFPFLGDRIEQEKIVPVVVNQPWI